MRLIVEDRDGMPGEFYADMQELADTTGEADGCLDLGPGTDGHVTILAIELPDGGYGWLKGTVAGEQAKALREAAAVIDELQQEGTVTAADGREATEFLVSIAERLERRHAELTRGSAS